MIIRCSRVYQPRVRFHKEIGSFLVGQEVVSQMCRMIRQASRLR